MTKPTESAAAAARRNIEIFDSEEWGLPKFHPTRLALEAEVHKNSRAIADAGYASGLDLLDATKEESQR